MAWMIDGTALEQAAWNPTAMARRPVVLLHEGLGSVALWKDFPSKLAALTDRRVVAYSRRGHGRSSPMAEPRRPDFMHREADILRRLLVEHALTDAILVGHSDGASIALIDASRSAVPGVVLLAPHVFVEALSLSSIRNTKTRFETTDLPARLGRYHDDAHHTFWAWNTIWLDPTFESWNIEAELASIRAPMLVIQGRDDEYGTAAQYEAIARAVPTTDVLVLGQCGHSPHRDRPHATLHAVAAFVDRIDPSPVSA